MGNAPEFSQEHQSATLYAGEVEGLDTRLQVGVWVNTFRPSRLGAAREVTGDIKSAKNAGFKDRAIVVGELCVYVTAKAKVFSQNCLLLRQMIKNTLERVA